MPKEIPTYIDVVDQEEKWYPEDIYRLLDNGSTVSNVAYELGVTIFTVRRYVRWREEGRTDIGTRYFGHRRAKRIE
jgi:transposase